MPKLMFFMFFCFTSFAQTSSSLNCYDESLEFKNEDAMFEYVLSLVNSDCIDERVKKVFLSIFDEADNNVILISAYDNLSKVVTGEEYELVVIKLMTSWNKTISERAEQESYTFNLNGKHVGMYAKSRRKLDLPDDRLKYIKFLERVDHVSAQINLMKILFDFSRDHFNIVAELLLKEKNIKYSNDILNSLAYSVNSKSIKWYSNNYELFLSLYKNFLPHYDLSNDISRREYQKVMLSLMVLSMNSEDYSDDLPLANNFFELIKKSRFSIQTFEKLSELHSRYSLGDRLLANIALAGLKPSVKTFERVFELAERMFNKRINFNYSFEGQYVLARSYKFFIESDLLESTSLTKRYFDFLKNSRFEKNYILDTIMILYRNYSGSTEQIINLLLALDMDKGSSSRVDNVIIYLISMDGVKFVNHLYKNISHSLDMRKKLANVVLSYSDSGFLYNVDYRDINAQQLMINLIKEQKKMETDKETRKLLKQAIKNFKNHLTS